MSRGKQAPSRAFDPALQELLRNGALNVIKITCPTKEDAIRYRSRLHRLRQAMQKENHTDWRMLYAACVRIDPADPKTLIVEPQDHNFSKLISKALGKDFKPAPTEEYTVKDDNPSEINEDLAEKFLKSLREK